eukprot:symbB.v1.2.006295.t1/scaffold375.1/size220138/13
MGAKGSTQSDGDGKIFTLDTLAQFDGTTMPSYISILGKVYDVSESSNFQAGGIFRPFPGELQGGYGDIWAGCDCTYALATLSLEKKDANRLDWEMSQFSEQELKALAAWKSYFDQKYEVVGVLKEYEGRDLELPELALGPSKNGKHGHPIVRVRKHFTCPYADI